MRFLINTKIKLLFLSILLFASCGKFNDVKNPLDGFKIILNYDIFDTFISLRFIDTGTNKIISTNDVTATISGVHKDGLVDQLGNQKDEHASVYGLLSLALNPKDPYIPTEDNPIQFSIASNSDDYLQQNTDITISETGVHYIDIYMEKSSALTQGYKKYTRDIRLINGALIDSFELYSSGKELELNIAKDVLLLDENHNPVTDTIATAELIVYTNTGKAPVPQQLVTDVENDENIEEMAFNPINIVSFNIKTATKSIHYTNNGNIDFTFGLDTNIKDPISDQNFVAGEKLLVFNYDNHWIKDAEKIVQENGDSLFVEFGTDHLSIFSIAILQSICEFTGNLTFELENNFPVEPIGVRAYCYRKKDNKYIGQSNIDITSQNLQRDYNFSVPTNNSVELRIRQSSNSNGFTAAPSNILVEEPCSSTNNFDVSLASTSINFKGKVIFHFTEIFPHDNFNVRVKFYNADNNAYLLSKTFNVSQDKTINIDSGVPNVQRMYLTFSAINQDDAFTANPETIYIENISAQDQSWNVNLTPKNCVFNGNFNFNYIDSFNSGNLEFKLQFIDEQTKALYTEKIVSFQSSKTDVPFSVILPKNEKYDVRIMRTGNGQKFHAYPYQFNIDETCENGINWDIELLLITEQFVSFNVTVNCPSAEILPTLQGFYRTVWENDWHNTEIVNGYIELFLEMNGTYQIGLIIDGEMRIEEYHLTDTVNDIIYELDENECDKMGW